MYLGYNSAILLLGIYQRERKAYVHTKSSHTNVCSKIGAKRNLGGAGYILFFDLGGEYTGVLTL